MIQCLGCRLANQIEPAHVVYEDEHVCAILDHEPYHEGHTLIIPKTHVVEMEELDSVTVNAIWDASIKLSKILKYLFKPDGVTICQNGGLLNDLGHYHLHIIPRIKSQPFYTEKWGNMKNFDLCNTRTKMVQALRHISK